ncbi:MAG: aspartate aminotransferase family protein [Candidatus Omnitrophota bacterium]|jgi:4-aminobutyrate aminotransferase-like enzyme
MAEFKFSQEPVKVPFVNSKFRKIKTKIPPPGSSRIFDKLGKYESRSMHGQMPVIWDRAKDFQVYDPYGNCWIDFTSTIFVTNTGHANKDIISALRKQLDKGLLHSYTYANEPRVSFLQKLVEMTPKHLDKAFLLSAGTEATECAVKLMRMNGQTIDKKKVAIISFKGSMHGRTMAAEMLKGDPKSSAWIGYRDPNIYNIPFPYPWTIGSSSNGRVSKAAWEKRFAEDMLSLKKQGLDFKKIAGFILESYIGWGAIFFPAPYVKALASFAKKYGCVLTFDDIQGGFGRTGKLFAYQHYGVEPDLVCLGKGISGSLPLSAVLGRRKILDLPGIGSMSSTHSANPLSCAAGLANIEAIRSRGLVKEAERKGKILHSSLNKIKEKYGHRISYVFGHGLLAAVLFKDPVTGSPDHLFPSKVCERAMQKGLLLVHTGRESIKLGPPLTIPDSALRDGIDVLEQCIQEIDRSGCGDDK